MKLSQRIDLLEKLGTYMVEDSAALFELKEKAYGHNKWFTPQYTSFAMEQIAKRMLSGRDLGEWVAHYRLDDNIEAKTVGIVMAGNIPLVGMHDFLSVFASGHRQVIKLSDKDRILLPHLVEKLSEWDPQVSGYVSFADQLNGCDAYIATGSNNSSRYFRQYFGRYPSLIRSNMTSVAVLAGGETPGELELLADDVHTYFGLGCRNVTHLFVPEQYDFAPLLQALKRYDYLMEHTKYRNNYDYNLALLIMNQKKYMTNGSVILVEAEDIFSPVSQLHYTFYQDRSVLCKQLEEFPDIQLISGRGFTPFGASQKPGLFDYADRADTMEFLLSI